MAVQLVSASSLKEFVEVYASGSPAMSILVDADKHSFILTTSAIVIVSKGKSRPILLDTVTRLGTREESRRGEVYLFFTQHGQEDKVQIGSFDLPVDELWMSLWIDQIASCIRTVQQDEVRIWPLDANNQPYWPR